MKDKDRTSVNIKPAKGRPWLQWVDKRSLRRVTAFPAQHCESFTPPAPGVELQDGSIWHDWPASYPKSGLLFHGDNKDALAHLLANGFRGKVNLIYIDPPFDSGADYVRKVSLRGRTGTAKLGGEGYTLGEQIQYTDIWANDNYLQFMYERILLLKELLAVDGSLALHCDAKRSHLLRAVLDEVFGQDGFRGEIIVRAGVKSVQAQFEEMSKLTLGSNTVFLYAKSAETRYPTLKSVSKDYEPGKWDTFWRGTDRHTMRYRLFEQKPETGQWRWEELRAMKATSNYRKFLDASGGKDSGLDDYYLAQLEQGRDLDFVRLSEDGVVQYYVPPRKYKLLSNVWMDLPYRGTETGFPTEKNEAIVGRLIRWITKPGDLVSDCFIGSGTAAATAQKLGRRWIGCDINKGATQTTAKRLQGIMLEQIEVAKKEGRQRNLVQDAEPGPAQLSLAVYRVNDYDLQVQHNEAVQLACEHIGVTRSKADRYFDGTMGKRLVKIVAFNHPLTPLDLEELKKELSSRPDEERDIVVVCLGKELAVEAWLEDWNRLRKRGDVPNKLEVIELRTDPKYGKFFEHKPASARVSIKRKKDVITVEIKDFISPTIIERLSQQEGVVAPKIDDWRQMVDSVMIDPAYDGKVFNIALSDVPEKKDDFVQGKYELPAPAGKTTVGVKITDMLGEEVLVTSDI